MDNYKSVFYESNTADNNSFEQWKINGSKTAEQRANEIWKARLNNYEMPAMDEAIDEELKEFIAKKKSSMKDMWY